MFYQMILIISTMLISYKEYSLHMRYSESCSNIVYLYLKLQVVVLLEGSVKRTKFAERGKKSRKHWVDCYMILTPTALVFYKDHKTYLATVSFCHTINKILSSMRNKKITCCEI